MKVEKATDNEIIPLSGDTWINCDSETENNESDALTKKVSFEHMDIDASSGDKTIVLSSRSQRSSAFASQRSISMEGYNAFDSRDRKLDTQALLFDSTPDLTEEDNYKRFPSIRVHRRGAVCYDCHSSLVTCNLSDSTTSL